MKLKMKLKIKNGGTNRKMTQKIFLFFFALSLFLTYFSFPYFTQAQTQEAVSPKAALFLSPRIETVLVGSRFDVSIFLNTYGNSINTAQLDLKFPPDKLTIVKPSGGQSFISLWVEAPTYSNVKGTASFVGGIPGGIITESGLLTTITFKAKASGRG